MDWTELITTLSACWGILAVTGVGILALPWSADELGASRDAMVSAGQYALAVVPTWRSGGRGEAAWIGAGTPVPIDGRHPPMRG